MNSFDSTENCCNMLQLLQAIQQYDLTNAQILLILDEGLVNIPCGPLRITSLQLACSLSPDNCLPLVNLLLHYGANVTDPDKLGRTPLHYAASNGSTELVRLLLDNGANIDPKYEITFGSEAQEIAEDLGLAKRLPFPECWGRTPLHEAVQGNHKATVKLLLERGASVDAVDDHGDTPLLLAYAKGQNKNLEIYEEIVSLLVLHQADVNFTNESTGTTALHNAVSQNSLSASETLLAVEGIAVNRANNVGKTALHLAAYAGSRDCVQLLLEHGGDLSQKTNENVSVIDLIISHVPRPMHFFNDVLSARITCNDVSVNNVDFTVTMDFDILSPPDNDKQMSVITAILHAGKNNQSELLQHPLIETFLQLKWKCLRIFFMVLVCIHVIFVFSLSAYVTLIVHQNKYSQPLIDHIRFVLLLSALFLFAHSLMECLMIPRHYFKQYEMWLNLFCAFFSFVMALKKHDPAANEMTKPDSWVLHISSSVVLAAWIELMLLMGRFPMFGYYALMFATVLQNVVKVLLTFVCLVIGFALSFSVQFYSEEQFEDPWRAIVKITVMLMGEFDYTDLFRAKDDKKELIRLPVTSRVIFLMFIVLSSIVLMNLMVGLAVSDIQGLQREGQAKRLAKQASFLSHLEIILSHRFIKSAWFPTWLCKKRYLNTDLILKPGMRAGGKDYDNKNVKGIPVRVLDSIIEVAINNTSYSCVGEESIDNKTLMSTLKRLEEELREIKQCLLLTHHCK